MVFNGELSCEERRATASSVNLSGWQAICNGSSVEGRAEVITTFSSLIKQFVITCLKAVGLKPLRIMGVISDGNVQFIFYGVQQFKNRTDQPTDGTVLILTNKDLENADHIKSITKALSIFTVASLVVS